MSSEPTITTKYMHINNNGCDREQGHTIFLLLLCKVYDSNLYIDKIKNDQILSINKIQAEKNIRIIIYFE